MMPDPEKPFIQLIDIVKTYTIEQNVVPILTHLSLDIQAGEMLAIVGPSGSGKSSLMNIIGLLDTAYQGEYWLGQQCMPHLDEDALAELRNQCIGFVFQQFYLLPRLTAQQNVELPLYYRQLSPQQIHQQAAEALAHVGMSAFAERKPTQLSGGQQQRVAIARALVTEPRVILADEPTGALDSQTSQDIMSLLLALNREGRTIVLITHENDVAIRCPRQIVLSDGQLISDTRS